MWISRRENVDKLYFGWLCLVCRRPVRLFGQTPFRVTPDDYRAAEQAAEAAGEITSEFAHRAVLLRVGGGMPIRALPNTNYSAPHARSHFEIPQPNTSALGESCAG